MAPHVLQPTETEDQPEDRIIAWWWLAVTALILIGAGGGYVVSRQNHAPATPMVQQSSLPEVPSNQQPLVKTTAPAMAPKKAITPNHMTARGVAPGQTPGGSSVPPSDLLIARGAPEQAAETPPQLASRKLKAGGDPQVRLPGRRWPPKSVHQLSGRPITAIKVPKQGLSVTVDPAKSIVKTKRSTAISLLAGPVVYGAGYDEPTETVTPQLSVQLRVGFEQILTDRWFVAAGLDYRHLRFQSAFEDVDHNARIYQPGTVDTIFRNLTTGEETVSTTDTVGGTRIRRFLNHNVVRSVGGSVLLGYQQTFGNHRLSLAAGPRVDFLLGREGKVVAGDLEITDFTDAAAFGRNVRWAGRLEAGYDWQPEGPWSISLRLGAETGFGDWSSAALGQQPRTVNGLIGLRYRW